MLIVCHVYCGALNNNKCKECECVVEFPLIHFNVLTEDLSQYKHLLHKLGIIFDRTTGRARLIRSHSSA